jgi:choline dehydrogenase-like flavoprotein
MEQDARAPSGPTKFEGDICIVGAGPAGITLARELEARGHAIVLLESGGASADAASQALNEGPTSGDPYAGLRPTRHRQLGGSAHLWNTSMSGELGAKFLPLDPWDFGTKPGDSESAWPFARSVLLPWYQRAQALCGLGPFEYAGAYWSDQDRRCFECDDEVLTSRVYQFGPARLFTEAYLGSLREGRKVQVLHHATVSALELDASRRVVQAVRAISPTRRELRIQAGSFVLACGAIENARLLLVAGLGQRSDWVGRGFMEHPRDSGLTLFPARPDFAASAGFYDFHRASDGTAVCGRLALQERALREGLPNASITLLPRWTPARGSFWTRLAARLPGMAPPMRQGYGWSHRLARSGLPEAFTLLLNLEQRPHPDNRIVLTGQRDALGIPRIELQWRWRDAEQAGLERLRTLVAAALERAGLGRVDIRRGERPDPNAHHHAGTTRMHADPELGVVDPEGRVHGSDNLYVTGASVFPSAGFANPVLTIVALALRLADRLHAGG